MSGRSRKLRAEPAPVEDKPAPVKKPRGRSKGRGKGLEAECEAQLRASGACWYRNEPPMRGRIRLAGGTPDYTAMAGGIGHLIECKEGHGVSIRLGCLTAPPDGAKLPAGITPIQAATLDTWERQGGRGWVLARLSGSRGEVTALIPWATWRGWLAAGEHSAPLLVLAAAGAAGGIAGQIRGRDPQSR